MIVWVSPLLQNMERGASGGNLLAPLVDSDPAYGTLQCICILAQARIRLARQSEHVPSCEIGTNACSPPIAAFTGSGFESVQNLVFVSSGALGLPAPFQWLYVKF